MKKQLFLLSLAFLLIAVLLIAPAQAANNQAGQFLSPLPPGANVIKYRGQAANAGFSQSNDGCVFTDTFVFVSQGKVQNPPGSPGTTGVVNVSIYRYDQCAGNLLLYAAGSGAVGDSGFQIDQHLSAARLQSTVNMTDWLSGNSFAVTIDLIWAGNGEVGRSKSHTQYQTPGCKYNSQFNGSFRPAIATGTVSDGSTSYVNGSSLFGDLQSAKSGSVTIGCGG